MLLVDLHAVLLAFDPLLAEALLAVEGQRRSWRREGADQDRFRWRRLIPLGQLAVDPGARFLRRDHDRSGFGTGRRPLPPLPEDLVMAYGCVFDVEGDEV